MFYDKIRATIYMLQLTALIVPVILLLFFWNNNVISGQSVVEIQPAPENYSPQVELQLKYLASVENNCTYLLAEQKQYDTWIPEEFRKGDIFLPYAYGEMYSATKNERFKKLALHAQSCLEDAATPFDPKNVTITPSDWTTLYWSTTLISLVSSAYYLNKPLPPVSQQIADYLYNLSLPDVPAELVDQEEIRRVRGLIWFYKATGEKKYLDRAREIMTTLVYSPLSMNYYVVPQHARAWCELFEITGLPQDSMQAQKYWKQVVKNALQLKGEEKDYEVLIWYQTAMAADACYQATKDEKYARVLAEALKHEVENIDPLRGGIIEIGPRKTLSLNAEITRLLVKYKDLNIEPELTVEEELLTPKAKIGKKIKSQPYDASNATTPFDKGIQYLLSTFSPEWFFLDEYIMCEGENRAGCSVEYRQIDVATSLLYLAAAARLNTDLFKFADEHLRETINEWKTKTIRQKPPDLYCALTYLYPEETKPMQENILKEITPNDEWYTINEYPYGPGLWRKVTDESYCVRALAKISPERAIKTFNKLITDLNHLAQNNANNDIIGINYMLTHALITLRHLKDNNVNIQFDETPLVDKLIELQHNLINNSFFVAETAFTLAGIRCAEAQEFANKLPELQNPDGSWSYNPLTQNAQSFTTLMALLAMSEVQARCSENRTPIPKGLN